MQVDKQLFQILNALDTILNHNRQHELPQLFQAAGIDKIINVELMNLARKLKRNVVVNFVATLITHNSENPASAPLILDAYQSVASGKMHASIADLPASNVIRKTIASITERKAKINFRLNPQQNTDADRQQNGIASITPSNLNKRLDYEKFSGSVNDHILSIELAIDHGHPIIAAEILKNLNQRALRGQDQKQIAEIILGRGDLSAKQVQGTPWTDWAECVEQALQCVRSTSHQKLRGELALWGARCHVHAGQYEQSIPMARKATWRTQVLRAAGEVARAMCFQGNHAGSIQLLDEVAKELCKLTDLVGLEWFEKNLEKKNKEKKSFNVEAAGHALQDLRDALNAANVQPFLVSGTLLGFAREGGLLTHDKDVDVGVLGWERQFEIVDALVKSQKFRTDFQALRGERCNTLVARHIATGCCIDIFLYRVRDGKLITGVDCDFGYVQEFAFTPFQLREVDFLGTRFFVPDDIELNLSENFGDWKNPDKDYISHLESPSTVDPGGVVHMLVARLTLITAITAQNTERVRRVVQMLRQYASYEHSMSTSLVNRIEELFGPKNIRYKASGSLKRQPQFKPTTWAKRISAEAVHAS